MDGPREDIRASRDRQRRASAGRTRDDFVDHHSATEAVAAMDRAVLLRKPFFLGVGMLRPHLGSRIWGQNRFPAPGKE